MTDAVEPAHTADDDTPKIDVLNLVARIANGSQLGQVISSLRPSRETMGEHLVSLVNLYELDISRARLQSQIIEVESLIVDHHDEADLAERFASSPKRPGLRAPLVSRTPSY
jgi:hypothetical protein